MKSAGFVDVVFDGPPGHVAGRFAEVEDARGFGVGDLGEWVERPDGYCVLRIPDPRELARECAALRLVVGNLRSVGSELATRMERLHERDADTGPNDLACAYAMQKAVEDSADV